MTDGALGFAVATEAAGPEVTSEAGEAVTGEGAGSTVKEAGVIGSPQPGAQ